MSLRDVLRGAQVHGDIRIWERPVGERLWRLATEADNVVLNQWYVDLFGQIGFPPGPDRPGGIDPAFLLIALGYGINPTSSPTRNLPPLRTDVDLVLEWTTIISKLTVATGLSAITSVSVLDLPMKLVAGKTFKLGTQTFTVDSPGAALGDTTIPVVSEVPTSNWAIGTGVVFNDPTVHVPQRPPLVGPLIIPDDPPTLTVSYFLPAAANSEPIKFTEAGLMYTNGGYLLGTHVEFDYTKGGNTDTRIDYLLSRESDE